MENLKFVQLIPNNPDLRIFGRGQRGIFRGEEHKKHRNRLGIADGFHSGCDCGGSSSCPADHLETQISCFRKKHSIFVYQEVPENECGSKVKFMYAV